MFTDSHVWRRGHNRSACLILLLSVLCLPQCYCQDENHTPVISSRSTKCYDNFGRPQRCIPGFENAAYNLRMEATNTCGEDEEIEYCVQIGTGVKKSCETCRYGDHSSIYLTDFNIHENLTWWQSETMFEGIQWPTSVNLTLHFKKSFDITYVRIWFQSPRPESFAIYKRTTEDGPWLPYQYYSATCRDTYGLPDLPDTALGEETRALCTSEYSDISPLSGGNVAFSTLQGRPGAYYFDSNPELQEWVTATDIMISLTRLNTFGDEVFGDDKVLQSYFYAIADVAVGARCKCNGHASECVSSTGPDGTVKRVCSCEHNTAGPDCNECLPFYNDAPWGRASANNSNECKPCNCNGFSLRCYFDEKLYQRTGHGGHCLDCAANRDGPNCERCRENYYQSGGRCLHCGCDEIGSRSLQCNREGKCQCKVGVTGDRCDRCEANYYDFSRFGCKPCGCSEAGSIGNIPSCDPESGICECKGNVEGRMCRECKPGYFNLDEDNELGCTLCFCYGHSSECESAPGYSQITISSHFDRNDERWTADDDRNHKIPVAYDAILQRIRVKAFGRESVYFEAPDRFLGDQRASYNRFLYFSLRIGESGPSPTAADIFLEGAGTYVATTIFGQGNSIPSIEGHEYRFRLHEHPDYGWQPTISPLLFMTILSNLTAIRIRATYTPDGVGFLDDVRLESAQRGAAGQPIASIERCECPPGYVGQHCESCAPGYRHSPARGGPFAPCVPCDCNRHADICDSETGRCICQHNTAGDNCELCAKGYYGNALTGTQFDCKPCLCPNHGACMQFSDGLVCLECPVGYVGPRCDLCADGYFGDPTGRFGAVQLCQLCECNLNVDPNAVGNCNRTTGECLKCIHNTGGAHCDQCLPGYYGNALAFPKGDCKPCDCDNAGTEKSVDGPPLCDQLSGQCRCKPHVFGRNCDQCEDGYFNIDSGEGCEPCNCDSTGSFNHTCDLYTGQCFCRPGITDVRCDRCEIYKYGFSQEGCKSCECDRDGSSESQCDPSGQCSCLTNVEGRKCDRCKENKYDRKLGCIDCPVCYDLVQDAVNVHRAKLANLSKLLKDIANNPTVIEDDDFENRLNGIHMLIDGLVENAKHASGSDDLSLIERLDEIRKRLNGTEQLLNNINIVADAVEMHSDLTRSNISEARRNTELAKQILDNTLDYLNTTGKEALERARQKSKEFGHQSTQMSEVAHEARTKAESLKDEARRIQEEAIKALNVSTQANEVAKKAIEKQVNNSDNIGSLKNVIVGVKDKLLRTKNLTEEASNRANEVYKEALDGLHEVNNIRTPEVNIKKLKQEAEWKKSEALSIISDTDKLRKDNEQMLEDLKSQIEKAVSLSNQSIVQQQKIDDLISNADLAKAQAEEAVALGDNILREAQDTYKTLSEFDEQVKASKESARKALDEVDEIQDFLYDTKRKTDKATEDLRGAEINAIRARDTAQDAQKKYAEQASLEAEEISKTAQETRSEASKLKDEAQDLKSRVSETDNKLKELEDLATNDEDMISEAKRKVGQAETDATEASKQVKKALEDVERIMEALKGLPNIDTHELDELEAKLNQTEREFEKANLDERIENVRQEKQRQISQMEHYEAQVKRLQAEVENIRDISESLPDGCFKRQKLEP